METTASRSGYNQRIGISKAQYSEMCKKASDGTKWWLTIPKAFIIGGAICAFGQVIFDIYSSFGLSDDITASCVSLTLIFISVLLTGPGLYEKIAKHAGAGTLVPITGFANSVAAPALEFKTEGMVTGIGAKIFVICGPVILYGTLASIIYGAIYYALN